MKARIINFLDVIVYSVLSICIMFIVAYFLLISGLFRNIMYFQLAAMAMMYIPTLATLITNFLLTKRNLSEFGVKFEKINLLYVFLALIYPILIILLSIPIALIAGIEVDITASSYLLILKRQAETLGISYETILTSQLINILIAPFFNVIFAIGEEIGWRGFLLTRLSEELDTFKAAVITGIIWGIWHWPLIWFFGYNYSYIFRGFGLGIFLIFTMGLGIFFALLRFKSGDVVMPALAHGAINAYIGFGAFIVLTTPLIGFPAGIIPSTLALIISLAFWFYFNIADKVHQG